MNTRKRILTLAIGFFLQVSCTPLWDMGLQSPTANFGSLVLRFHSDRSSAQTGESVHMNFTVTNEGSRTWVIESAGTPVLDIIVKEVGGPELFSWSAQNPDKVAHRLEWKPGESKVIALTWIPRQEDVRFGMYHDIFLTGTLSENSKVIQSAGVTVCASNFCR